MTVLPGPNGSGKSTVFDVFAFLSESFESNVRHAWDRRGRARELKSRGSDGPLVIEIKYQESDYPLITYHLAVDERNGSPVVVEEWLQWKRGSHGKPLRFLEYHEGKGRAASGERPDIEDTRDSIPLKSPDCCQCTRPVCRTSPCCRVARLHYWMVCFESLGRQYPGQPEAGPQYRLSRTGDNLANVIQYLAEQHPDRLERIFTVLRSRVPRIGRVLAEAMPDGRLLLTIKDAPFQSPILARFASDGTLKMLAYLALLYDPAPPPFIGIEEPENFLYPRLLYGLAEECRSAAERGQLLVTTHSPFFLNALRPEEVRVLYWDADGYARVSLVSEIQGISDFIKEGALLGDLWIEGHFGVGDPLVNAGAPTR